ADVLTLRWSERHPWDTQLMAGGAVLAAEDRTRDGAVSLDCLEGPAAATPVGRDARGRAVAPGGRACLGLPGEIVGMRQDRTLHFRLPEATTATPAGPVCLLFRLPNQRVLPLRRAGE